MMASSLSLHIQCPVCLSDFVDPVSLPCQHSYCRQCITGHANVSLGPSQCPECRQPFSMADIRPNRDLRNIIESIRKAHASSTGRESPKGDLMCEEHDEKRKLFCETDQKLICVICKEQEKHQGHTFAPVKEASEKSKGVVERVLGFMCKENKALEDLITRQLGEISKCEEKYNRLKTHISAQFETLHEFLRKKEEDMKKELEEKRKKSVTAMQEKLADIQAKAADGREREVILQNTFTIPRPDHFLQWWQEIDFAGTEDKKEEQDGQTKPEEVDACGRYRSQAKDLVVIRDCLSMGPYETHMAYCVWREVLQKIQPGPARVSIKDLGDSFLRCSPDGHSIRRRTRSGFIHKNYNPSSSTNQTFQTGRHYCELEVGGKTDWSIGVKAESTKGSPLHLPEKEIQLHLKKGDFVFTHDGVESPVSDLNTDKPPRRIGLYLDCDGQQVSFYDADTMTLIASSFCSFLQPCSISVCPGLYMEGKNRDPLTFYWH
ncbi:nuclear factor 7, brain-like isoform X1 [Engraulis encrasicolus]|uniref:nuclear factor 7, brain-like isoform X1 n=1 Tax=Engraulis encrasicolus TaxID=184585 RepID=UPI002FD61FDE